MPHPADSIVTTVETDVAHKCGHTCKWSFERTPTDLHSFIELMPLFDCPWCGGGMIVDNPIDDTRVGMRNVPGAGFAIVERLPGGPPVQTAERLDEWAWADGMDTWAPGKLAGWLIETALADQDREEIKRLIAFFKGIQFMPDYVMEIGVLNGGTLDMWQAMWPAAKVLGIDFNPQRAAYAKGYEIILGDSRDPSTLEQARGRMPVVDLLHIDGDHDPDAFWSDWVMYAPLVRHGGYVLVHDTVGFLPDQWERVMQTMPGAFEIAHHPDGRCGMGVVPVAGVPVTVLP